MRVGGPAAGRPGTITTPPEIVRVTPDSDAVNVKVETGRRSSSTRWSATAASGATDLDQLFLVSPRDGAPTRQLAPQPHHVRPRTGLPREHGVPITLLPGLDRPARQRARRKASTLVFSTGPTIPAFGITGVVFDWAAERAAPGASSRRSRAPTRRIVYVARGGHHRAVRRRAARPGHLSRARH